MINTKTSPLNIELPPGIVSYQRQPHAREPETRKRYQLLRGSDLLLREPPAEAYGDRPFLDIRGDFGFKHVFGREENKELLIHFLNSLYEGHTTIRDVRYCPTEFLGEDPETREIIYDILCYTDDDRCFLLEMQRAPQDFYPRRAMHYGCRLISQQVPAGKAGDTFGLNQVNIISILDFELWDDPCLLSSPRSRYLRTVDNTWVDNRMPFNDVHWLFIQLPAFGKGLEALKTDQDRWFFLFRRLNTLTEQPPGFNHPVFQKLFDITTVNKLSKKQQDMYHLTIDGDRDWRNAISFAKRTGEEEGEERGEKRGERRGEKRGEKRGKDLQGRLVVQNLIENTDFSDEKIADLAAVAPEVVKKVRAGR